MDGLFLRVAIRNKKGDTDNNLADYDKIVEIDPNVKLIEVIYVNRSTIYLKNGEFEKALADLDKAVSINPKVPEVFLARAIAKLLKDDCTGAIADYDKSIDLRPNFSAAFSGRGDCRLRQNDSDGALTDYNKAISLNSKEADVYVKRGIVRGLKNDFSGALNDLQAGANLNPKSVSRESRGIYNFPYKSLNNLIRKNPENAKLFVLRGIFHKFQLKNTEAESDFNMALTLDASVKKTISDVYVFFQNQPANKSSK
ncbi:MAG TPA: tetratricopeptide repeat protein [Pyrinomonadaceae bacterium]|nr:tetratricopeptide repeat protein [Pyrinomonadaceae bacterium]